MENSMETDRTENHKHDPDVCVREAQVVQDIEEAASGYGTL